MKYSRLQNVYLQKSGLSKEGYQKKDGQFFSQSDRLEILQGQLDLLQKQYNYYSNKLDNELSSRGLIFVKLGGPLPEYLKENIKLYIKNLQNQVIRLDALIKKKEKEIAISTPILSCEDHFPSKPQQTWNMKKKFCQLYQKNVTDNKNNFKSYLTDAHFLTKDEIDKISIQRDGYGHLMYYFDGKSTGVANGHLNTPCEQIRGLRYCTGKGDNGKNNNKHGDAGQQYQEVFKAIKNGGKHPELDQIQTNLNPLLNKIKILNKLAEKDNNIKKIQRCNFKCYLDNYPDLKRAFGNNTDRAMRHYINNGIREGRNCNCKSS